MFAVVAAIVIGLVIVAGVVSARAKFKKSSIGSVNLNQIDAFTLGDPWRRYVQSALSARRRIGEIVSHTSNGPIKDRLNDIASDVDRVVAQVWAVAQTGHALSNANRQVREAESASKLAELNAKLESANEEFRESILRSIDSLRLTTETSDRIRDRREAASAQLREMDVRLDELVARSAEVATAGVDADTVDTLRADMDALVIDLEGLKQGLDETRRTATA